jgi:hypothetical protein
MNTSITNQPLAERVTFDSNIFTVHLKDARSLSVPLAWFPTLANASETQLKHYELLGDGEGIHWIDLDEDISVKGLLLGQHEDVA